MFEQAPSSKLQAPLKHQMTSSKRMPDEDAGLDVGAWGFSGDWKLEVGACSDVCDILYGCYRLSAKWNAYLKSSTKTPVCSSSTNPPGWSAIPPRATFIPASSAARDCTSV